MKDYGWRAEVYMRQQEVAIENIQPIQRMVHDNPVLHYMRKFLRQDLGEAVAMSDTLLLPLERRDIAQPERFIILDGHHRTRAAHEVGRVTVLSTIFETDADLESELRTRVLMNAWKCQGVVGILDNYHEMWEPLVTGSNMHHVGDLWMFGDEIYVDEQTSLAAFGKRVAELRTEMTIGAGLSE